MRRAMILSGVLALGVVATRTGAADRATIRDPAPTGREFTFADILPYLQATTYVGTDDMTTPVEEPTMHVCEEGLSAAKLPDAQIGRVALAAMVAAPTDAAVLQRMKAHVKAARMTWPKAEAPSITGFYRGFLATDPVLIADLRARVAEAARAEGMRCRDCRAADPDGTWSLHWRRENYWPAFLDGALTLREGKEGWSGAGWVETIHGNRCFFEAIAVTLEGDRIRFKATPNGAEYSFDGRISGGTMDGSVRWSVDNGPEQRDSFVATRRDVRLFESDGGDGPFVGATAEETGLSTDELTRFVLLAEEARSDGLVVVSDGRLICHRSFGAPVNASMDLQSIAKAISSLAVPLLIREGKISGVDEPVSRWVPELAVDGRKAITLRHVLTHSTGLEVGETPDVNKAEDRIAHALSAKLVSTPGSSFEYSNRAMQLLPAVVRAASGEELDDYLAKRLFQPLGLTTVRWARDRAGHAGAYAGLSMSAMDLATIGSMLAARGRWKGAEVVPAEWIDSIAHPSDASTRMGLGWFRFGEADGEGFMHSGDGGQYLIVAPEAHLVIGRLARIPPRDDESAAMQALWTLATHLVQSK